MAVTAGEATGLYPSDLERAQTRAGLGTKDTGLSAKTGQPVFSYPWEGKHPFCL